MLGKLLKYEFRSTARVFLPLYPALLIMALLNKLIYTFFESDTFLGGIPKALLSTVYGVILIGIIVITFLVMIQRFYKNLLGDEGYLMFTLPVKSGMLITSKLIVATVWNIASTFIATLSIIILLPDYRLLLEIPRAFAEASRELSDGFGISLWVMILLIGLLMLAASITMTLLIYVSIALGHLVGRHKLLASFAAYLIVSTITETIAMIIIGIYGYLDYSSNISQINSAGSLYLALISISVFCALFSALYFFVTQKILDRKLNIE